MHTSSTEPKTNRSAPKNLLSIGGLILSIISLGSGPAMARASEIAVAQRDDQAQPASSSFETLALQCAPHVDTQTLAAVVRVESGYNPYAIGVVGAHLERQPRTYAEAVATAHALVEQGFDFSMGLGQVNIRNLAKYGESIETIFDPCRNLRASGAILQHCFVRSLSQNQDPQGALRNAFSCYYSGNFSTGYRLGYVARVIAGASNNARQGPKNISTAEPIHVVATRRLVDATRVPNSSPAGKPATKQCINPNARQFVQVHCTDNPQRWCRRCFDTIDIAHR